MEEKIDKALEVVKRRLVSLTLHADMQKAAQAVLNLKMARCTASGFKQSEDLEEEFDFLIGRVRANLGATEMQQVTQAVLHLVQAKAATADQTLKRAKTS